MSQNPTPNWRLKKNPASELLTALDLLRTVIETHGEWDDGCFYYGGKSAPELQEPLRFAREAIAAAKGGRG